MKELKQNKNRFMKYPGNIIFRLMFLFSAIMISFTACKEQQPVRRTIVSPEIHQDKSITFRYLAPGAEKVELSAEFLSENLLMTKDEDGLWTTTTGPVTPDIYPYFFIVDGIQVHDPNNTYLFPNERFKRSVIEIPGDPLLLSEIQEVPHGNVTYRYYKSQSLDLIRPVLVYTPPDYGKNPETRYPVLYLIHGMTDTEETWFKVGRVNVILDNMIAQGLAEPMIIVMPYANPLPALLEKNEEVDMNVLSTDYFTDDLINDVLPFTENNYSVYTDAGNRAIAGFSLGGRQTLAAGLGNPDKFAWVCAFSPAIFSNELENNFKTLYASPASLNSKLKLLWVSCGKDDGLYDASVEFTSLLEEKGIRHRTFFSEGGHTWMNCRLYLSEIAKLIFN